jgi:hypothetical protein
MARTKTRGMFVEGMWVGLGGSVPDLSVTFLILLGKQLVIEHRFE